MHIHCNKFHNFFSG